MLCRSALLCSTALRLQVRLERLQEDERCRSCDWLSRVRAVCSFLARGKPTIRLAGDDPVVLKAVPIAGNVSVGLSQGKVLISGAGGAGGGVALAN